MALALLAAVAIPAMAAIRIAARADAAARGRLECALGLLPALFDADARLRLGEEVPPVRFFVGPPSHEIRVADDASEVVVAARGGPVWRLATGLAPRPRPQ